MFHFLQEARCQARSERLDLCGGYAGRQVRDGLLRAREQRGVHREVRVEEHKAAEVERRFLRLGAEAIAQAGQQEEEVGEAAAAGLDGATQVRRGGFFVVRGGLVDDVVTGAEARHGVAEHGEVEEGGDGFVFGAFGEDVHVGMRDLVSVFEDD